MNQQIINAFQFRHACKEFLKDKKISDTDFKTIIESGRLSPSSFGFEPWKFLVIQDEKIREKLKHFCWGAQTQLPSASHFIIILAKKGQHLTPHSNYIENLMKKIQKLSLEIMDMKQKFFKRFQEEDFSLKTDVDRLNWAKRQTYIPLANMMTVAALLQIDSCPIEGFNENQINKILAKDCNVNLDEFEASVMVAFGYRIKNPKEKTRQDQKSVIETFE